MIIRNSARCLNCGDEIESTHRHDFVTCSCGEIFVDGGTTYQRYGFTDLKTFEDTSVYSKDPEDG